ncbi:MAG: hypothetical protein CMQ48_05465, partial [Gammaproteobacteria bacterium]|nr:hypothetical protein [Gammaproteobacteria bacterium]
MRKLFSLIPVALAVIFNISTTYAQSSDEALAIIVPGGGTYSRSIGTDSAEAQAFFDQGIRMAWGFYFPESI